MPGPTLATVTRVRQPLLLPPYARSGKSRFPYSLQFDGANTWATSTFSPFTGNSISIAAWVKRNGTAARHVIVGSAGVTTCFFSLESGANTVAWFADSSLGNTAWTNVNQVASGIWCHLVLVHDHGNNQASLYVNGVLNATNAFATTLTASATTFEVGIRGASLNPFSGNITNVQIWQSVLTAAQVAALYDQGVIPTANLAGAFLMQEGGGFQVADASGKGSALTLAGTFKPYWSQDVPVV